MMRMIKYTLVIVLNFLLVIQSISSMENVLIQMEENLLYTQLHTRPNLSLFYQILLKSNGIDDPTRMERKITPEDIQQLHLENKCFQSLDDLLNVFDIRNNSTNENFTREDIRRLSPALISVKFNEGCTKPTGRVTWKNILIGLITVTFINCSALCGAIILPFRKRPAFKWILSTFIGLAVGTLTGSGIFHLIPMAFNIPDLDTHHNYLNKALIPMIMIYLYYMRDQLLKIFLNIESVTVTHTHGIEETSPEMNGPMISNSSDLVNSQSLSNDFTTKSILKTKANNGLIENLKTMKAAGWMIFIGDMLHNFIDGLTLGAAFMVSIGEGLRMSFPIICEEFPHELGDIAVLLSSGLTIGQALIMNFLSACSCYLGFMIGAKLGELEEVHPWIYALAGGMFVYIGLADMIPELVSMGDEIEKDYLEANRPITIGLKLKILLCQNSGLVLGVIIMFILGKYGEHLENLVKF